MGKCKACGREIIWIMSPSGKAIPCDVPAVTYRKVDKAKDKVVTLNGEVVSCTFPFQNDVEYAPEAFGYVPHWATCTDPERFRRKK